MPKKPTAKKREAFEKKSAALQNPDATPAQLSRWLGHRASEYLRDGKTLRVYYRYDFHPKEKLHALEKNPNLKALLAEDTSPQSPLLKGYWESRYWRAVYATHHSAQATSHAAWAGWALALAKKILPIYEKKCPRDHSFAKALQVLHDHLRGEASLDALIAAATATRKGRWEDKVTKKEVGVPVLTAKAASYALFAALNLATSSIYDDEPTWVLVRDFTNATALAAKVTTHIGWSKDDTWLYWKSNAEAAEWSLAQLALGLTKTRKKTSMSVSGKKATKKSTKSSKNGPIILTPAQIVEQASMLFPVEQMRFSIDCAEHVLPIWERSYPDDIRPFNCIAAARLFASEKMDRKTLTRWRQKASAAVRKPEVGSASQAAASAAAWCANGHIKEFEGATIMVRITLDWCLQAAARLSRAAYNREVLWQGDLLLAYQVAEAEAWQAAAAASAKKSKARKKK